MDSSLIPKITKLEIIEFQSGADPYITNIRFFVPPEAWGVIEQSNEWKDFINKFGCPIEHTNTRI